MSTQKADTVPSKETKAEIETMSEKCATCAFRSGTKASRNSLTVLKARLCAQIGQPFQCHENTVFVTESGKAIGLSDVNRIDIIGKVPRGEYQPRPGEQWKNCAGWAELVSALEAKGLTFTNGWQFQLTEKLLEVIDKAEFEGESWDDSRVTREIKAAIDAVGACQS